MTESVKPPAKLKKKLLSPKQNKLAHFQLGKAGENLACAFLTTHHYQILATNVMTSQKTELDIVALDKTQQEIVFVEVKARTHTQYGHPSQAINWRKQCNLKQAAMEWLKSQHSSQNFRFDLITISAGKVEHFKNITGGW